MLMVFGVIMCDNEKIFAYHKILLVWLVSSLEKWVFIYAWHLPGGEKDVHLPSVANK